MLAMPAVSSINMYCPRCQSGRVVLGAGAENPAVRAEEFPATRSPTREFTEEAQFLPISCLAQDLL
jgi:hypothetical protein